MRAILMLCALIVWAPRGAWAEDTTAGLMVYRVVEAGIEPYISRILVTPGSVRMDEGTAGYAYTLFDREAGVLYNVDDEERTVLVIDPPRDLPDAPVGLDVRERERPAGTEGHSWTIEANGAPCLELDSLPGAMGGAVAAVAHLYERLAHEHGRLVTRLPPEALDACDLALNVYAPRLAWSHGLPLKLVTPARSLELLDHETGISVDGALFTVPADYRRMEMPVPGPE